MDIKSYQELSFLGPYTTVSVKGVEDRMVIKDAIRKGHTFDEISITLPEQVIKVGVYRIFSTIFKEKDAVEKLNAISKEPQTPASYNMYTVDAVDACLSFLKHDPMKVVKEAHVFLVLNSIFNTGSSIFNLDMSLSEYKIFRAFVKKDFKF